MQDSGQEFVLHGSPSVSPSQEGRIATIPGTDSALLPHHGLLSADQLFLHIIFRTFKWQPQKANAQHRSQRELI